MSIFLAKFTLVLFAQLNLESPQYKLREPGVLREESLNISAITIYAMKTDSLV